MTVTIELALEIEEALAAIAAEQGVSLSHFVRRVLEERIPRETPVALTPAERARVWRDSVRGLPPTKPLSDDAISRESLYAARG
jgi:hypothetical protein